MEKEGLLLFIVCKGVSTPNPLPISKSFPPISQNPLSPSLPANQSSHVFLVNRNATVKLSSTNTIHVKQQHNLGFFIFKITLNYMLSNVCITKIHPRHCLYISLYHRDNFSHFFNFFECFSMEQLSIDSYRKYTKQLFNTSLVFILIAI